MHQGDPNVGLLCDEHSDALPQQMMVGDQQYLKVRFPLDEARSERMWVAVTAITDRVGILNNDPLYAGVQCGDIVTFERRADGFLYAI